MGSLISPVKMVDHVRISPLPNKLIKAKAATMVNGRDLVLGEDGKLYSTYFGKVCLLNAGDAMMKALVRLGVIDAKAASNHMAHVKAVEAKRDRNSDISKMRRLANKHGFIVSDVRGKK